MGHNELVTAARSFLNGKVGVSGINRWLEGKLPMLLLPGAINVTMDAGGTLGRVEL